MRLFNVAFSVFCVFPLLASLLFAAPALAGGGKTMSAKCKEELGDIEIKCWKCMVAEYHGNKCYRWERIENARVVPQYNSQDKGCLPHSNTALSACGQKCGRYASGCRYKYKYVFENRTYAKEEQWF